MGQIGHLATPLVALPGVIAKFVVVKALFLDLILMAGDVEMVDPRDADGTGSQVACLHNGISLLGRIPEVRRG